jgi:hypothetical protein
MSFSAFSQPLRAMVQKSAALLVTKASWTCFEPVRLHPSKPRLIRTDKHSKIEMRLSVFKVPFSYSPRRLLQALGGHKVTEMSFYHGLKPGLRQRTL